MQSLCRPLLLPSPLLRIRTLIKELDWRATFEFWHDQSSAICMIAPVTGKSIKLWRKYQTNLKIYPGRTRFFQFCHRDRKGVGSAKLVPP